VSEQLLTLFKFGLLAVLYVFFLRVLWAVWAEIKSAAVTANAAAAAPKATAADAGFSVAVAGAAAAQRSASVAPPVPAGSAPPVPASSAPPAPAAFPDPLPDFGTFGADPIAPPLPETRRPDTSAPGPRAPNPAPTPSGRLIVREPADAAGMTYRLATEIAGCGICIDDTFVSQLHARVFRSSSGYFLEDLGSTNGTFHNTHRLAAKQPEPLELGDYVQFGSTVLEFT